MSDGSYRLVLMNADGSPGVNAAGRVELKVPGLFVIGISILCGGVVVGLIGLALLIIGYSCVHMANRWRRSVPVTRMQRTTS